MAFNRLEVNDLATATLDDSDQVIVGESNTYKKATVSALKNNILGSAPSYTTDTEPYLMRRTAHVGVVGKCALNKLVGGSLGWNQLANPQATTQAGVTITVSNGTVTINGTATANIYYQVTPTTMTVDGHVYFVKKEQNKTVREITWYNDNKGIYLDAANDVGIQKATGAGRLYIRITSGAQVDAYVAKPQFIDLTATFGSTIADYVYGLESATAGAGVAWFSRYIDLGTYHAYDAGSIQSVQATAHVTTGKNLIDQTQFVQGSITGSGVDSAVTIRLRSPFVKVLPNTQYSLSVNSEVLLFEVHQYDANKNWLGYLAVNATSYTFTTRSDVEYFKLLIRYSNNATIVVSALTALQMEFGSTATAYEPYTAHTYPLGSDTLRGYPMLVNNKLAFDGDEKYPNGTTKRKYGIVDLGTLPWTKYNVAEGTLFRASIDTIKRTNAPTDVPNIICSHYPVKAQSERAEKTISQPTNNSAIDIIDSAYTDATAFKTAMSGVYLVYPLATETTESSTAYQKIQTIDADGTESFTTSSPVPVGHETQTPDNILAALSWVGE